jgi:hypothetical protein
LSARVIAVMGKSKKLFTAKDAKEKENQISRE